jgi:WW domain-containing oxidoreductase
MSLYSRIAPKGPNGFGYGSTAEQVTAGLPLAGRTILLTGCNSGLGLETMRVLALRGAHVIGAARTLAKAQAACAMVGGQTTPIACELSSPASVRACVAELRTRVRLDALICNAGIMALPQLEQAYGYELQFFANHIGHFMLVTGLLGALTDDARVVMLSSAAHTMAPRGGIQFDNLSGDKGYKPWAAYGQSKFANLLFAKELARRFGSAASHDRGNSGGGRTANAVHPGVIQTNLARHMGMASRLLFGIGATLFCKSTAQGAATGCYVAVHPGAAAISGAYFADCNVRQPRADANDPALARRLWEVSETIVAGLP